MTIPFNKPFMTGKELWYVSQAHAKGHLAGDGAFAKQCSSWLEQRTGSRSALLTHSCTAALEMAAMLVDTQPGDEIIMPSYTFVSTANAFVLRGGVPVFVDNDANLATLAEHRSGAAAGCTDVVMLTIGLGYITRGLVTMISRLPPRSIWTSGARLLMASRTSSALANLRSTR